MSWRPQRCPHFYSWLWPGQLWSLSCPVYKMRRMTARVWEGSSGGRPELSGFTDVVSPHPPRRGGQASCLRGPGLSHCPQLRGLLCPLPAFSCDRSATRGRPDGKTRAQGLGLAPGQWRGPLGQGQACARANLRDQRVGRAGLEGGARAMPPQRDQFLPTSPACVVQRGRGWGTARLLVDTCSTRFRPAR